MTTLKKLHEMRAFGGKVRTQGLSDAVISDFLMQDANLNLAIDEGYAQWQQLKTEYSDIMQKDEADQLASVQEGFLNFYQDDAVNPYITVAARGPWVVTSKGAVLHDSGGYGMLGFGHAPQSVLDTMAQPSVMANVMTPNFSHRKLINALRKEIGQKRGECPFNKFLALNSGSEAVGLATRITDANAKLMTETGARYAGRQIKFIGIKGAFHGRTDRPAQISDSSRKTYRQHLATFRNLDNLITVDPNDVEGLRAAFAMAEQNNWYVEAMFLEPVMGEGNPGAGVTPAFYAAARELTKTHGALFVIDSIQAGLRAHGYLSILDYPGFENLEAPDMETYSKALNAGQFPLSILALSPRASDLYKKGLYGNTMTTNPRAMEVACTVLSMLTAEVRKNIADRGKEFVQKLEKLAHELPGMITGVQGTGLLFSCELSAQFKCFGVKSTEEYMRERGIGVIHGGVNSLRFTPHFLITSKEVDLIIDNVRLALLHGPRLQADAQAA